eukprot:UN19721
MFPICHYVIIHQPMILGAICRTFEINADCRSSFSHFSGKRHLGVVPLYSRLCPVQWPIVSLIGILQAEKVVTQSLTLKFHWFLLFYIRQ